MEAIQSLRNTLKDSYRTNGIMINISGRCILTALAIFGVNSSVGSIGILQNPIIALCIALFAGIIPVTMGIGIVGAVAIAHIFNTSMLLGVICAVLFLLTGILSLRLAPGVQYAGLIAFVLAANGAHFAAPLILAMGCTSLAVTPMLAGLASYQVLGLIKLSMKDADKESLTDASLKFADLLLENRNIILIIVVTGLGFLVATAVKKMAIDHSWKIALLLAATINLVGVVIGNILLGSKISFVGMLTYTVIGFVIALIVEIFVHDVDYRSVEMLDFEDDEYFYYVKAVPKKTADIAQTSVEMKLGKRAATNRNTPRDRSTSNRQNTSRSNVRTGAKSSRTSANTRGSRTRSR